MFSQEVEIFQAADELSRFFRHNSLHVGPCDRGAAGKVMEIFFMMMMMNDDLSGFWDHGQGWEDSAAGQSDESDEDLQAGQALRWAAESHLHSQSGYIVQPQQKEKKIYSIDWFRPTRSSACSCCWWGWLSSRLPLWSTLLRRWTCK